jgi:hypothetical protein
MAPSIKNFATPVLMFAAHVAQKCVLERGHTKLCHVVTIVKWKAKCVFDVVAMLLIS